MRVVVALFALALVLGVFALLVGTSTPILAWCGIGGGACGLAWLASCARLLRDRPPDQRSAELKFTVEFQDYEPRDEPINTADVEEALFELLDRRGDDGIVIVAEIVEDEDR